MLTVLPLDLPMRLYFPAHFRENRSSVLNLLSLYWCCGKVVVFLHLRNLKINAKSQGEKSDGKEKQQKGDGGKKRQQNEKGNVGDSDATVAVSSLSDIFAATH